MKKIILFALVVLSLSTNAQNKKSKKMVKSKKEVVTEKKAVVYQVFTRLFGNKNTTNKPWGTIEENAYRNKKVRSDPHLVHRSSSSRLG